MLTRAWQAGLGPDLHADLTVDFDSTICRVFGAAKQGAKFGYTHVRGYHPLLATLAGTNEVLHARMRGGNAGAARAGVPQLVGTGLCRAPEAPVPTGIHRGVSQPISDTTLDVPT